MLKISKISNNRPYLKLLKLLHAKYISNNKFLHSRNL